jgi:branched-chain amino acid transport system substrate-binding protein
MKRSFPVGMIAVLLLVLIVCVAACGEESTASVSSPATTAAAPATTAPPVTTAAGPVTTSGPATTAAAGPAQTLKIGGYDPISTPSGLQSQQALQLAVDDFNASGGVTVGGQTYKLDLVFYDDKGTTDGGKAAGERLVNQDKVSFIVGPMGGAAVLGGQSVSEAAGVPLFLSAAINDLIGPNTKISFRGTNWLGGVVKWAYAVKAYPNVKTVVQIAGDSFLGKNEAAVLDACAKGYGLTVTKHIYVADGTTDFSSVAASAVALKPDIICTDGFWGQTLSLGSLFKALYQAGYKGPKITSMFNPVDDVKAAGSPDAIEQLICIVQDPTMRPDGGNAIAQHIKQVWIAKYTDWMPSAPQTLDPFYQFIAALKKADSVDPAKVVAALQDGLTWDSYMGSIIMIKRPDLGSNRFCDALSSVGIGEWSNGQLVYKDTIDPDAGIVALEKVFGFPGGWK